MSPSLELDSLLTLVTARLDPESVQERDESRQLDALALRCSVLEY